MNLEEASLTCQDLRIVGDDGRLTGTNVSESKGTREGTTTYRRGILGGTDAILQTMLCLALVKSLEQADAKRSESGATDSGIGESATRGK